MRTLLRGRPLPRVLMVVQDDRRLVMIRLAQGLGLHRLGWRHSQQEESEVVKYVQYRVSTCCESVKTID